MKRSLIIFIFFIFNNIYGNFEILENKYLLIGVEVSSGRFYVQTKEGNPDTKTDNNKILINKQSPPPSRTFVKIDDFVTYIGSPDGYFSKYPKKSKKMIYSEWNCRGISFIQTIQLVMNYSTGNEDLIRISYIIHNKSGKSIDINLETILNFFNGYNNYYYYFPDNNIFNEFKLIENENYLNSFFVLQNLKNTDYRIFFSFNDPYYYLTKPESIIIGNFNYILDNPFLLIENFKNDYNENNSIGLIYKNIRLENDKKHIISFLFGMDNSKIIITNNLLCLFSIDKYIREIPFNFYLYFLNNNQENIYNIDAEFNISKDFIISDYQTNKININEIPNNNPLIYKFTISNTNDITSTNFLITLNLYKDNKPYIDITKQSYINKEIFKVTEEDWINKAAEQIQEKKEEEMLIAKIEPTNNNQTLLTNYDENEINNNNNEITEFETNSNDIQIIQEITEVYTNTNEIITEKSETITESTQSIILVEEININTNTNIIPKEIFNEDELILKYYSNCIHNDQDFIDEEINIINKLMKKQRFWIKLFELLSNDFTIEFTSNNYKLNVENKNKLKVLSKVIKYFQEGTKFKFVGFYYNTSPKEYFKEIKIAGLRAEEVYKYLNIEENIPESYLSTGVEEITDGNNKNKNKVLIQLLRVKTK